MNCDGCGGAINGRHLLATDGPERWHGPACADLWTQRQPRTELGPEVLAEVNALKVVAAAERALQPKSE